ncbi:MAG: hypothetical protein Q7V20_16725 [Aquabacterium sp.]|uniref:hypothetical protein n=1 Tax=Aquabacterium sp. TaxID=1872578 RepID=UPI002728CA06|nr:hypothetical protein [Aquabacterium sp.]MDO9005090.1 hypothetical protein [Aquabacterium sp.]
MSESQKMQVGDASPSEVMRDAPRILEALRADIQKGADSGQGVAAETVFAEVRERIAQVGSAQSGGR